MKYFFQDNIQKIPLLEKNTDLFTLENERLSSS